MRLGISYSPAHSSPEEWAYKLKKIGCTSTVFLENRDLDEETILAYKKAAEDYDIVIAEVGVWNSPIADNPNERAAALAYAKKRLKLADMLEAKCCVNVAGSTGPCWYSGVGKDRTKEGWNRIVSSIQEIIDDVNPTHTVYSIECMPIVPPTSPDEYLKLMKDVDRKQFAVHLDAFNMLFTPDRYFSNADFMHECFEKLGPYIKSIHAKDVTLTRDLTYCILEAMIGEGNVDYSAFLQEVNKLDPEMPVIIEHRDTLEEYQKELEYVKECARKNGVFLYE